MSSGWIIVLCRGLKASLAPVLTTLVKSTFHCKVVCQCIQIGRKIEGQVYCNGGCNGCLLEWIYCFIVLKVKIESFILDVL